MLAEHRFLFALAFSVMDFPDVDLCRQALCQAPDTLPARMLMADIGERVQAEVDRERRKQTKKNFDAVRKLP